MVIGKLILLAALGSAGLRHVVFEAYHRCVARYLQRLPGGDLLRGFDFRLCRHPPLLPDAPGTMRSTITP
jgi:hypothetical protein